MRRIAPGSLPYGVQRRLELARAMATDPELLLLDEPAAGMNEDECADLVKTIERIHQQNELYDFAHRAPHECGNGNCAASSRLYVLTLGEILAHGTPAEVQKQPPRSFRAIWVKKKNDMPPKRQLS
jgi:branched-chain amino acid transport system ATP-binding protein